MPLVAKKATVQPKLNVEVVKQYPGQQQVDRAVKVMVPGRHFPQLEESEQRVNYEGTAVEHRQRHAFGIHRKAWHRPEGAKIVLNMDVLILAYGSKSAQ